MILIKELILEGRVQGVGMRFFCSRTAASKGVKGYVKNQFNGTVKLVIEGEEELLNEFKKYIQTHAPGRITNILEKELTIEKSFKKFSIRYF